MVQFKTLQIRVVSDCGLRRLLKFNYWQLGFEEDMNTRQIIEYLEGHGYKCRRNATKSFAMDVVGRYQRGLISYEHLGLAELQAFLRARGLSSKATTAARLARVLEKADDAATFPRFLELPPEIRNSIYEIHLRGLDDITTACRQPPLTLASSQLRAEILPLFYERANFVWESFQYSTFDSQDSNYFTSSTNDAERLMKMPAAMLSQVKNFGLTWHSERKSCKSVRKYMTLQVTQRGTTGKAINITGLQNQSLDRAMHSTVQSCNYWDDDFKLQPKHIEALGAAVNQILRWSWTGHY